MRRIVIFAIFLLSLIQTASAVTLDTKLQDPQLEKRARHIAAGLRCLVCQNQSIDDSDAPLAHDLRMLVRNQLSLGKSDDDVIDYIVDRYGEYVLLRPRFTPKYWLLWLAPFILALVCGCLLFYGRRTTSPLEAALSQEERDKFANILKHDLPQDPK